MSSSPPNDPARADLPRVSVVTVAYGREDWLRRSVTAALASTGVDVEVVVVDNGGTEGDVDALADLDGVTIVRPGANTGFAGGCNLGVASSDRTRPFVALVNPDAIVAPDALAELVAVAAEPDVAVATGSIRLADRPEILNSAGNMVHFLGVSWSGHFDEPASAYDERVPVTAASGAGMACRREVWDALGGLCEELFAYYEDADLSLRAWHRGWSVEYVPTAVVEHRYEFSRNPVKFRLLERNRAVVMLSCFTARHLLAVAPFLLALELGILLYAAKNGWLREKVAGYRWLAQHAGWLRRRRAEVQAARTVPARELVPLYAANLDPKNIELPESAAPLDKVLARYWALVRPLVASGR